MEAASDTSPRVITNAHVDTTNESVRSRSDDPFVNKLCFDSWANDMETLKAIVAADHIVSSTHTKAPPPTLAAFLRTMSAAYTSLTNAQKFTRQCTSITGILKDAAKQGAYHTTCIINAQPLFYYEGLEKELAYYFRKQGVRTELTGGPPAYVLQCAWE